MYITLPFPVATTRRTILLTCMYVVIQIQMQVYIVLYFLSFYILCNLFTSFSTTKSNISYTHTCKVKFSFSLHVSHRLGHLMVLHFCFSVCLRLQVNPQNRNQFHGISPERGFADFIFAHIILHIVIMNFIG